MTVTKWIGAICLVLALFLLLVCYVFRSAARRAPMFSSAGGPHHDHESHDRLQDHPLVAWALALALIGLFLLLAGEGLSTMH